MAERPILIFPRPTQADRSRKGGGGKRITPPSPIRQSQRLQEKFDSIVRSFQEARPRVDGLPPEHVIVLVAAGNLTDVARAAARIPGLEWLAELDLEPFEQDEYSSNADDAEAKIPQRLFALMSNQQAMDHLVALWGAWHSDPSKRAQRHFGPFKQLFVHLRDLRRWSPEDRLLDTGIQIYWEESLAGRAGPIRFEAELWYRADEVARTHAAEAVRQVVVAAGGQMIAQASIPAILYHALLLECPAATITAALGRLRSRDYVDLLRCEEVMFFRPSGQAGTNLTEISSEAWTIRSAALPKGAPIVALLDGLPLENHEALAQRVIIDDAENVGALYRPGEQFHGTAMASLIVHGDLNEKAAPLSRPIYAAPVMRPEQVGDRRDETFPSDKLFLDVLHRAIRRMLVGESGEKPSAPSVRLINLSLGNAWHPFIRELSPLAKLIDWLSWEHNVLFLISTGNYVDDVELDVTRSEHSALSDEDATYAALRSVFSRRSGRRLISPAESMNALTVGAVHGDHSGSPALGPRIDLVRGRYPSPINRLGLGLHRAVKPEILLPGGRQLYEERIGNGTGPGVFRLSSSIQPPGQRVAAPSLRAGELNRYLHSRGTSNATALATRLGAQVYDRIIETNGESEAPIDETLVPLVVKTLLVHSAMWTDPWGLVAKLSGGASHWTQERSAFAQILGFGEANPERALSSAENRALLVGAGRLRNDQGHVYSLPIPDEIRGEQYKRRLVVTVGWLSPINVRHREYRRAGIYLDLPNVTLHGAARDADDKLSGRGTIQHRVFEEEVRRVFDEQAVQEIKVNCKEYAGGLESEVPYALAVTLEVADPLGINIYDPIRTRLRVKAAVVP